MANPWWAPQGDMKSLGGNMYMAPMQAPETNPAVLSTIYNQPSGFANVLGSNYGNYAQGLSGLGHDYAGAYGAYSSGLGNIAGAKGGVDAAKAAAAGQIGTGVMNAYAGMGTAAANAFGGYGSALASLYNSRANEASARYGATALAEAARQGGLASLGSAALGAYGSASNAALAAWAANQQAYNDAAAREATANQQGISQYGQSKNMALGSMAGGYGEIGKASIASNVLGNMSFNFGGNGGGVGGGSGGGNGFRATGPNGSIASGTYGSGGGSGGGISFPALNGSGSSTISKSSYPVQNSGGALSGLSDAQNNIMDPLVPRMLAAEAQAGREQLDTQHYSSRGMPAAMQANTLGGLMAMLNGQGGAYSQLNNGMNQFYANNRFSERPYREAAGTLSGAYGDFRNSFAPAMAAIPGIGAGLIGQIGSQGSDFYTGAQNDLARGYGQTGSQLDRLSSGLAGGYGTANAGVRGLYDNSIGSLPMWNRR